MATLANPILRGCIVGDLACQRDSYLQVLDSEVVSCVKWLPITSSHDAQKKKTPTNSIIPHVVPDLWLIEFTDSVLFPEGGGQPSDQGTILSLSDSSPESIPIAVVQRQGLRCIYHSPKPLSAGSQVRQQVDFQRRRDYMQQHTGQHLLSAIMDTYDNLKTLGWGMGSDGSMNYVDLPRNPSIGEMQAIQDKCNEIVRNNLPITVETLKNKHVKDDHLPNDYDQEKGIIRVVKIGEIDSNPCCGTHLSQTSHISLILLHYTQPVHSKNFRLYFTAGDRAINLASTSINSLRTIAKLLSSGSAPNEVISNVEKANKLTTELKRKEKKLLLDIAKYEGDRVKAVLQAGKNAWVYHATEGLDFINMIVFVIKETVKDSGLVVILASGEGQSGGAVVIIGEKTSVEVCVDKIKEVISGIKGGGGGGGVARESK